MTQPAGLRARASIGNHFHYRRPSGGELGRAPLERRQDARCESPSDFTSMLEVVWPARSRSGRSPVRFRFPLEKEPSFQPAGAETGRVMGALAAGVIARTHELPII